MNIFAVTRNLLFSVYVSRREIDFSVQRASTMGEAGVAVVGDDVYTHVG